MLAGLFLRRQFVRARERGHLGSGVRRITRSDQRVQFDVALVSHALGALICFAAAFLCLTHSLHGG